MKRFLLIISFLFSSFSLPPSSFAQDPFLTLLPNARADYRFDYRGDRTPIDITADAPEGVELYIYAPDQDEAVGGGSRKGNELRWSGRFNAPGVYHAVVENKTPGPIQYRITIKGESVSGIGQILADEPAPNANVGTVGGRKTLTVNLPPSAGRALRLTSPGVPTNCTPVSQLPLRITASLKLCPNEIYPPLRVVGNGIGLFADDAQTAIINSGGRQFALNVEGVGNWIDGVVIQSSPDAADAGAFLCQYEECIFPTKPNQTILRGGLTYGGGILVNGSNSTVHNVTVRGGTIGVAMVNGHNNFLLDSELSDLNGWGSFNIRSANSYFVGNTFNRDNHGCTTPDGFKFEHGCETAGWVCLACNNNVIARNHCEASGNCYYMSGERGLGSNNNRFVANYCAGSPNNCFEFTFSKGNILQDNVTTADPQTGATCKYPFWIGGSTVYFGKNTWGCAISPEESLEHAINSTTVPTVALQIGSSNPPTFTTAQPTVTHSETSVASITATATVTPTATPTQCNPRWRVQRLFSWQRLQGWVRCAATPRLP